MSKPQAWYAFALSFLLMAFDFIDRQIVVSMFPHLKAEWGLSDQQLGALISIVSVTVAIGALPLSLIIDNWSRVNSGRPSTKFSNSAIAALRPSRAFNQIH